MQTTEQTLNADRDATLTAAAELEHLTPGVRIERKAVSPEQATYWLAVTNVRNRPLNQAHVRKLVSDYRAGRWKDTHQGIAFDCEGRLLDGQHRLAMVRELGEPVMLNVWYGLSPDAMEGIDQNYKRTAGHMLAADGVKAGKRIGALARAILVCTAKRVPTHPEVIEYAHKHLETLAQSAGLSDRYSAGVAAAFAYAKILGWSGGDAAAQRLVDLKWSGDGDPMRALAKALAGLGGKSGANAIQTKFFTTLNALRYVDKCTDLQVCRRLDHMPGS